MTPRPSKVCYNDLNGLEVGHVTLEQVRKLLTEIPYLQRHLTLPRVRISVAIRYEVYAEQPTPETHDHTVIVEVDNVIPGGPAPPLMTQDEIESQVDSSPHGDPPDKIREDFGIPVPQTAMVRDGAGRGLAMADFPTVEGKIVEGAGGMVFDRTGNSGIMGGGTVVTLDSGKAGLDQGVLNRDRFSFGNRHAGSDGKPASPDFSKVKRGAE